MIPTKEFLMPEGRMEGALLYEWVPWSGIDMDTKSISTSSHWTGDSRIKWWNDCGMWPHG